jgi:hypothetical protein
MPAFPVPALRRLSQTASPDQPASCETEPCRPGLSPPEPTMTIHASHSSPGHSSTASTCYTLPRQPNLVSLLHYWRHHHRANRASRTRPCLSGTGHAVLAYPARPYRSRTHLTLLGVALRCLPFLSVSLPAKHRQTMPHQPHDVLPLPDQTNHAGQSSSYPSLTLPNVQYPASQASPHPTTPKRAERYATRPRQPYPAAQ